MSRIYTQVVTVGNTDIYNVTSDPNGVLEARKGSLAIRSDTAALYQNVNGSTTWSVISSSSLAGLLDLTDDITPGTDTRMLPIPNPATGIVKTISFTATEDMTLQYLVFSATQKSNQGTALNLVTTEQNNAHLFYMAGFSIVGTGPDAGKTLVDGFGVPGGIFAESNIGITPVLNIRLAAGDVLTIDLYSLTPTTQLAYAAKILYASGLDLNVTPKRFIAAPAPIGAIDTMTGVTPATGNITVANDALVLPGEVIDLLNVIGNSGYSTASGIGTVNYGNTLTGVAGARTPGNNDFNANTAGITPMRDEILAALTDPLNDWSNAGTGAYWAFAAVGPDQISCTRLVGGAFGNTDEFTTTSAGITLVPATGSLASGTSAVSLYPMITPTIPTTIQSVVMAHALASDLIAVTPPVFATIETPSLMDVLVNAVPSNLAPRIMNTNPSVPLIAEIADLPVLPGDTIDMAGYNSGPSFFASYCLIGEET